MEKLEFVTDDGDSVALFVLEETRINGKNYILVSETDDYESEMYIMRDDSDESSSEANYVEVSDDVELEAVAKVFEELMSEDDN